ncbi:hypothetical protein [Marinicella meishanensis]|uniref:hypothetical protein n=1 Tax=Marinicella meishanensis TaxID=2873263 RepID=UPI001CBE4F64|nr:hypothetical protein [Marinicella sp. NBU2979]
MKSLSLKHTKRNWVYFIPVLFFHGHVLACGEKIQPEISIEVESAWTKDSKHCVFYQITVPETYQDEVFQNAVLKHGEGANTIEFADSGYPLFSETDSGESIKSGMMGVHFCANPEWLKDVELTLMYRIPPTGGWSTLCGSSFKYENLNQFVKVKASNSP